MKTYITICKIDSQWGFAVWLSKLKQGLCINSEGWDLEGGGREVQKEGDICKYQDFSGGSDGKASAYDVGDLGLILGSEDPLEEEMATHSSTLAWKIPWAEEAGRLQSPWGHKESDMTEQLHFHFHMYTYG